ncbi:MAG: heme exporter protein CcmB [Candidatus Neomarinimicrobiota bacterium]|nr:heme exporter protein CcmB [Candidatus Neomarinimicrobiota bacterium]MEC9027444.1 heme exporter protein CcmB [Candidatus Neomarinimicrobiota bacterium]|tara:strand:- start:271 stop:933 length:663 start_codon:yes stop_codon:yes gene_type:complete
MFYTLVRKDLLLELRTKEIIIPMFAFGLVIILIFSLSFNASQEINHTFSPGLLWIIILFISSLGLHRMFVLEKEFDAFTLNLAAPIDRGVIFLSKVVSGTIILLIAEILIIPPFVIFLNLSIPSNWPIMILILIIGDLGIMSIGAIISGLSMRAKLSEILFPILFFPLVSPHVIACVKATNYWFKEIPFFNWQSWIYLMITFFIIFFLVGFMIFDFITEE